VVLVGTIAKGKNLRSIVSKVLIQMNAKVGGIPWAVDNLPFMSEPTMICGMDVFHSTSLGKKSVLALTASMNQSATTYWSTSVVQDEIGQEGSTTLQTGIVKALESFKKHNGAYPGRIIFYRDGVGEGQVQGICVPEIEQIKSALVQAGRQDSCKLMYINCCKRVNTRIFDGQVGAFKNPQAGTVIDSCVTDKDVYEFYLVSVAAKQGMSTPTRFTVLYDSIGTSPDQIEHLTYKLCHTYYNVSGAIKEPSCIRYAHRLAALVGERGGKNKAPPVIHSDFEKKDPCLYFI
jgi:aubergine-like protein